MLLVQYMVLLSSSFQFAFVLLSPFKHMVVSWGMADYYFTNMFVLPPLPGC